MMCNIFSWRFTVPRSSAVKKKSFSSFCEHGLYPLTQPSSHHSLTPLPLPSSSPFLPFPPSHFFLLPIFSGGTVFTSHRILKFYGTLFRSSEKCFSHFSVNQKAPLAKRSYSQKTQLMEVLL